MTTPPPARLVALLALATLASSCGGGGGGGGGSRGPSGGTLLAVGTTLGNESFAWESTFPERHLGDYGQYIVLLEAGRPYEIATANSLNGGDDPYLYLLDRKGAIVAEDDNSGGALEAKIAFTPPRDDRYFVRLRAAARGAAGRCSLSLVDATPAGAGATPLALGTPLPGQPFEWRAAFAERADGRYGEYVVDLEAGRRYEIVTSAAANAGGDTYLYVLSGATIVAENDDDGAAKTSRIELFPQATGTYVVRLRAAQQGASGTCTIAAADLGPAPAPTPTPLLAGTALADQEAAWRSGFPNREDGAYGEYVVPMTAGSAYVISTESATVDTYLYVLDRAGEVVAEDDDDGGGTHSLVAYAPPADGDYIVRLRAFGIGDAGRCTIRATEEDPGALLLPNLRPLADAAKGYLYDVFYEPGGTTDRIRFTTAALNDGVGPMDMYLSKNARNQTRGYQRIRTTTGRELTRLAGVFVFAGHENHSHFHFDDFSTYALREILPGDGVGPVVAESTKISFCLEDVDRYAPGLAGSPAFPQYDCNDQGISIGWADVYNALLQGQEIDIGNVPSGVYWLEHTVNPSNLLVESSTDDNDVRIKVQIDHATGTATVIP